MLLNAVYVLGALWGGGTGLPVCSSNLNILSVVNEAVQSTDVTAFVNVNVVPMDAERILTHQTVLVEAGLIAAVGPASQVKIPANAVRIDGQGKYLMPGLTDMHAHLNILFTPDDQEFRRRLFGYLAHGVTAVRHLVSDRRYIPTIPPGVIDSGYRPYRASPTPVPRLYLAAMLPPQQSLQADSMAGYLKAARTAGYDFVAVPVSSLGRPSEKRILLDSLLAAAYRLGIPLGSHDHGVSLEDIVAFGAYGGAVEHLYAFRDLFARPDSEVSAEELRARAVAVARAGTWMTVTLDCTDIRKQPADNLAVGRRIVNALQAAGAGVLLGGDADGGGIMPPLTKEQEGIKVHFAAFRALADSLTTATPPSPFDEQVRQRLAAELTAMRVILNAEQRELFDPAVRVWLREQARQGHRVTVANVKLVP